MQFSVHYTFSLMMYLFVPPGGDHSGPAGQHQLHGAGGCRVHQRSVRQSERADVGGHSPGRSW